VVIQACDTIIAMAEVLGDEFNPMAEVLFEPLIGMTRTTKQVMNFT